MLYVNPIDSVSVGPTTGVADKARSEKAALQELEHLFMFTLLKEMRKSADMGNEKRREVQLYEEMLDDALSGAMAKSNQFGLAQQLQAQLNLNEAEGASEPCSDTKSLHAEDVVLQFKHLQAYADNNMDSECRALERPNFIAIGSSK